MSGPINVIPDENRTPDFTIDGVGDMDQYENCQALIDLEGWLNRARVLATQRRLGFGLAVFERFLNRLGEIRYVEKPGLMIIQDDKQLIIDGLYMWEPFSQDQEQLLIPFTIISNPEDRVYNIYCHANWDMNGPVWFGVTIPMHRHPIVTELAPFGPEVDGIDPALADEHGMFIPPDVDV